MKVKKIDIKVENMEVANDLPYLKVAVRDQISAVMRNGDRIPDFIPIKEKTYLFRKVKNFKTGDIDIFAVEVNEDKLFTDLIEVTKGFIDEVVEKTLDKEREYNASELFPRTQWEERQRIKKLSWHKRLFNKF